MSANERLIQKKYYSSSNSDECEPVFSLGRLSSKEKKIKFVDIKKKYSSQKIQKVTSMDSVDEKLIPTGFYEINLNDDDDLVCKKSAEATTNTNNNNNYLNSYWFPKAHISYA